VRGQWAEGSGQEAESDAIAKCKLQNVGARRSTRGFKVLNRRGKALNSLGKALNWRGKVLNSLARCSNSRAK
jgi:hypothetical protein